MLPPAHRMRRRGDFTAAVRGGARAPGRLLVLHGRSAVEPSSSPALIGFVVPKSVGNAVVRNRVQRRLRHLLIPTAALLPDGSLMVVRVLPAAAGATIEELGDELTNLLPRLERRWASKGMEVGR